MYIVGKIKAERGTKLNALNLSETSESNGITKAAAINPLPISVKYLKKSGLENLLLKKCSNR